MQIDSYSIKQVFDEEKQDLAIFHAKAVKCQFEFLLNSKA